MGRTAPVAAPAAGATTTSPRAASSRFGWIYGARADLFIAFCWVPIFLAAHWLTGQQGNDHLLNVLFNAAFVLSLLHQPLTLALVYGDKSQFALRPKLFTWSPIVAVVLIVIAVMYDLWIIVPIAALWNTIHTLQQRYGLSRIYGRKGGFGSARLDRGVLFSWMVAALVIVGATPRVLDQLARVMLDSTNANAIRDLASVQSYAIWLVIPAVAVALMFTGLVVRQEQQHLPQANQAKWVYQGSSLLLIATIAWDPLAGFIAYVSAHAIEYFVVVYKTMQSRYGKTHDRASILGKMVNTTWGRVLFLLAFLGVIYEVDQGLGTHLPNHAYLIIVYSLGILHFWYDSFIWKLRRPVVAKAFDLEQQATSG
ncbi:MAG TPA: hypothetical protein VID47_18805 [Actinomycetota bacterium]